MKSKDSNAARKNDDNNNNKIRSAQNIDDKSGTEKDGGRIAIKKIPAKK